MVENLVISRKFIFRNFFLLLGFFLILGNFSAQAMDPPPVQASEQLEEATRKLENLPIRTTSGAIPLHNQGFKGRNIKIAVLDEGLSYALKGQRRTEFSEWDTHWDVLNEHKLESLKSYTTPGMISEYKIFSTPPHGPPMLSHIRAVSPESIIVPLEIDNLAESFIGAIDALADDPTIHILNLSWKLPGSGFPSTDIDSRLRQSLLNCLEKGKVIVLAAGNLNQVLREPSKDILIPLEEFFSSYVDHDEKINLFQDYEKHSKAFSNLLVVGSTALEDDSQIQKNSVKPGNGLLKNHYIHVNANHARTFFDKEDCIEGWGGTSSSTAAASGLIACLWEASGLQTPGSEILKAILESGEKHNRDSSYEGQGKFNPTNAYNYLYLKKIWEAPDRFKDNQENICSKLMLTDTSSKLNVLKILIEKFNVWKSESLNDILNEVDQPIDNSKTQDSRNKLFNFILKNISLDAEIISNNFARDVTEIIGQGKVLNKVFREFISEINYNIFQVIQRIDLPKNFIGLKKIFFNNSKLIELTGLENVLNLEELWAQNTPLEKLSFPAPLKNLKLILKKAVNSL